MQQQQLVAGDTLYFLTTVPGYKASEGWVLRFRMVSTLPGGTTAEFTATAEGDDFRVNHAPSETAQWPAGTYSWTKWVKKDATGEVYSVDTGFLTILPDPRQVAAGYDSRSKAQIALANCEAAMATFNATGGKVKKYEIAGRTMEFQSIAELMTLHSFWQMKVLGEGTAASVAAGMGNPRNLYTRFVSP